MQSKQIESAFSSLNSLRQQSLSCSMELDEK